MPLKFTINYVRNVENFVCDDCHKFHKVHEMTSGYFFLDNFNQEEDELLSHIVTDDERRIS